MKQTSNKESRLQRQLAKVYAIIDEKAHDEERFCCWSCGSHEALSHSHILGRGSHKEFMLVIENIILQCSDCHTAWEHRDYGKIKAFKNLEYIFKYLAKTDTKVFWDVIESINFYIDTKTLENEQKRQDEFMR